jgi:hypothetical protein
MSPTLVQYYFRVHAHTTMCELMVHPDERLIRGFFAQLRSFLNDPVTAKSTLYSIDTRNLAGLFSNGCQETRNAELAGTLLYQKVEGGGGDYEPAVEQKFARMSRPEYSNRVILLAQNFDLITHENNLCTRESLGRNSSIHENLRYFYLRMLTNLWTHFLPAPEWERAFLDIWTKYSPKTKFSLDGTSKNCRMMREAVASTISHNQTFSPSQLQWVLKWGFPLEMSYDGNRMMALRAQLRPAWTKIKRRAPTPQIDPLGLGAKPAVDKAVDVYGVALDWDSCFYVLYDNMSERTHLLEWVKAQRQRDLLLSNTILLYFMRSPSRAIQKVSPLIQALRDPGVLVQAIQAYREVYPRILLFSSTERRPVLREGAPMHNKSLDLAEWGLLEAVLTAFPNNKPARQERDKVAAVCTFRALKG